MPRLPTIHRWINDDQECGVGHAPEIDARVVNMHVVKWHGNATADELGREAAHKTREAFHRDGVMPLVLFRHFGESDGASLPNMADTIDLRRAYELWPDRAVEFWASYSLNDGLPCRLMLHFEQTWTPFSFDADRARSIEAAAKVEPRLRSAHTKLALESVTSPLSEHAYVYTRATQLLTTRLVRSVYVAARYGEDATTIRWVYNYNSFVMRPLAVHEGPIITDQNGWQETGLASMPQGMGSSPCLYQAVAFKPDDKPTQEEIDRRAARMAVNRIHLMSAIRRPQTTIPWLCHPNHGGETIGTDTLHKVDRVYFDAVLDTCAALGVRDVAYWCPPRVAAAYA